MLGDTRATDKDLAVGYRDAHFLEVKIVRVQTNFLLNSIDALSKLRKSNY